jgi:hypothetical protein
MKPICNSPVLIKDIDWSRVENEEYCMRCPCWNCDEDGDPAYACKTGYCEYGEEMCPHCLVRAIL